MKTVEVEALADMHFHLREGEDIMASLIHYAIDGGADVLGIMPNLLQALINAHMVVAYKNSAICLVPNSVTMTFVPFVMITEETTEREIDECKAAGINDGKAYPYMRTTKSTHGIKRYGRLLPIIKHCGTVGMKCHFHPEHSSLIFNNRDAEFSFVALVRMFLEESQAIIVWEHGTDARCIPHWKDMATSGRFLVTLTAHHLATNEDLAFGDVRSVCKPPVKTERDRQGLVDLVGENHRWLMAGTDSAWHPRGAKHVDSGACSCGAFTSQFALPLYAQALEPLLYTPEGIETFVNFTSRNARSHFGLPPASRKVKLVRARVQIPHSCSVGKEEGLPFWAGQTLNWRIDR